MGKGGGIGKGDGIGGVDFAKYPPTYLDVCSNMTKSVEMGGI